MAYKKKGKVGRPKGSKNKVTKGEKVKKGKVGRPKGSKNKVKVVGVVGRPRGRPRKNPIEVDSVAAGSVGSVVKRPRGRPRKVAATTYPSPFSAKNNLEGFEIPSTVKVSKFYGYCPKCDGMMGASDLVAESSPAKYKCAICSHEMLLEEILKERRVSLDTPKDKRSYLRMVSEINTKNTLYEADSTPHGAGLVSSEIAEILPEKGIEIEDEEEIKVDFDKPGTLKTDDDIEHIESIEPIEEEAEVVEDIPEATIVNSGVKENSEELAEPAEAEVEVDEDIPTSPIGDDGEDEDLGDLDLGGEVKRPRGRPRKET